MSAKELEESQGKEAWDIGSGATSQEWQLKEMGTKLLSRTAVQNQNGLPWKDIPDPNDPAEADGRVPSLLHSASLKKKKKGLFSEQAD